jgi:hypothetical protein
MLFLLFLLLIISTFLEGTVTTLPLVFVCFVVLTILMKNPVIFFLAFFAGILLDTFALRTIGGTSIFLLVITLLILLYQRKYEINTYPFVLIASFVGSVGYLLLFGYGNVFLLAIISAVFAGVLYSGTRVLITK